ncbi:MAG: TRAP transporter substrate-binding protein [Rhizobiaceae bacterium]|nr:TRAP transporter substrate-binding protein [Rhizobiaceae bacterium]MCV0408399.1 TRAP transporter substrate-binding protein [Rhizobiaceae bacterium]
MTRRGMLAAGAASSAALFAPALVRPARAVRRLTVASLLAADKPETKIWLRIAEIVEERLPGAFAFNVVENAALGGEREVAEGVRLGSIQGTLFTVSALSAWVPESQIFDLPFLFRDASHLRHVAGGEVGMRLRQRFAGEGFVAPAFIDYGARHLLAKQPITRPHGLDGLRMRVIQSPLHVELWKAYGAVPTAIPITETYNALATGVVDVMDLTKSAYAGFRLYEVVPVLVETGHIRAAGIVCFSASFWDSLSDEEKTVFEDAAREGAAYFDQLIQEDEKASVDAAVSAGATMVQAQDRPAWERGGRIVWQHMADTVGGMERIERIKADLG